MSHKRDDEGTDEFLGQLIDWTKVVVNAHMPKPQVHSVYIISALYPYTLDLHAFKVCLFTALFSHCLRHFIACMQVGM